MLWNFIVYLLLHVCIEICVLKQLVNSGVGFNRWHLIVLHATQCTSNSLWNPVVNNVFQLSDSRPSIEVNFMLRILMRKMSFFKITLTKLESQRKINHCYIQVVHSAGTVRKCHSSRGIVLKLPAVKPVMTIMKIDLQESGVCFLSVYTGTN